MQEKNMIVNRRHKISFIGKNMNLDYLIDYPKLRLNRLKKADTVRIFACCITKKLRD